jgi:hypothetical protein
MNVPFDPIAAAAMIWTAQPQSIDATEAVLPTVFASEKDGQLGTVRLKAETNILLSSKEVYASEAS